VIAVAILNRRRAVGPFLPVEVLDRALIALSAYIVGVFRGLGSLYYPKRVGLQAERVFTLVRPMSVCTDSFSPLFLSAFSFHQHRSLRRQADAGIEVTAMTWDNDQQYEQHEIKGNNPPYYHNLIFIVTIVSF
jgi:hypothetical protein